MIRRRPSDGTPDGAMPLPNVCGHRTRSFDGEDNAESVTLLRWSGRHHHARPTLFFQSCGGFLAPEQRGALE